MNEREIISTLPGHIDKISKDTGAFEIIDRRTGLGEKKIKGRKVSMSPDLILKIRTKTKRGYTFYVEVKSTGQPRYVRSAVNQLQEMTANEPKSYGRKPDRCFTFLLFLDLFFKRVFNNPL